MGKQAHRDGLGPEDDLHPLSDWRKAVDGPGVQADDQTSHYISDLIFSVRQLIYDQLNLVPGSFLKEHYSALPWDVASPKCCSGAWPAEKRSKGDSCLRFGRDPSLASREQATCLAELVCPETPNCLARNLDGHFRNCNVQPQHFDSKSSLESPWRLAYCLWPLRT